MARRRGDLPSDFVHARVHSSAGIAAFGRGRSGAAARVDGMGRVAWRRPAHRFQPPRCLKRCAPIAVSDRVRTLEHPGDRFESPRGALLAARNASRSARLSRPAGPRRRAGAHLRDVGLFAIQSCRDQGCAPSLRREMPPRPLSTASGQSSSPCALPRCRSFPPPVRQPRRAIPPAHSSAARRLLGDKPGLRSNASNAPR